MLIKQVKDVVANDLQSSIMPANVDNPIVRPKLEVESIPSRNEVKAADDGGGDEFQKGLVSRFPKAVGSGSALPSRKSKQAGVIPLKEEKKTKQKSSNVEESVTKKEEREDVTTGGKVKALQPQPATPSRLIDKLKMAAGVDRKDKPASLLNKMSSIFHIPPPAKKSDGV